MPRVSRSVFVAAVAAVALVTRRRVLVLMAVVFVYFLAMRGLFPKNPRVAGTVLLGGRSHSTVFTSSARVIAFRRSSCETGLQRKSVAPFFIAMTMLIGEGNPETIITGRSG